MRWYCQVHTHILTEHCVGVDPEVRASSTNLSDLCGIWRKLQLDSENKWCGVGMGT